MNNEMEFKEKEAELTNLNAALDDIRKERLSKLFHIATRFHEILNRSDFETSEFKDQKIIEIRFNGKICWFPKMSSSKTESETYLAWRYGDNGKQIEVDLIDFNQDDFNIICAFLDKTISDWEYTLDHKDLLLLTNKISDAKKLLEAATHTREKQTSPPDTKKTSSHKKKTNQPKNKPKLLAKIEMFVDGKLNEIKPEDIANIAKHTNSTILNVWSALIENDYKIDKPKELEKKHKETIKENKIEFTDIDQLSDEIKSNILEASKMGLSPERIADKFKCSTSIIMDLLDQSVNN